MGNRLKAACRYIHLGFTGQLIDINQLKDLTSGMKLDDLQGLEKDQANGLHEVLNGDDDFIPRFHFMALRVFLTISRLYLLNGHLALANRNYCQ